MRTELNKLLAVLRGAQAVLPEEQYRQFLDQAALEITARRAEPPPRDEFGCADEIDDPTDPDD